MTRPSLNVRQLLTRRAVLKLGLGTAGAALLVGGGGAAWLLSDRPAGPGLLALSNEEAVFVRALGDTLFPPENPIGVAAADVDIVGGADAYIDGLLPRDRRGLRALLTAVEQWPRVSLSSGKRFSELPLAGRIAIVRAFEDSTVTERRMLGSLLRTLIGLTYFDDPRVLAALAFRPGCLPTLPAAPDERPRAGGP
jgi:hypothetical protein